LAVCGIYRIWKFRITFLYYAECVFYIGVASEKTDLLHSLALSAFIILILDTQQFLMWDFNLVFCGIGIFWLNQPF
jgi:competence protein ComEC